MTQNPFSLLARGNSPPKPHPKDTPTPGTRPPSETHQAAENVAHVVQAVEIVLDLTFAVGCLFIYENVPDETLESLEFPASKPVRALLKKV